MGRYVLRRLLQMIPLLVGITILTFVLANLLPGSPISDLEYSDRIRPEDLDRIKHHLGLDQPLHVRYFVWLGNCLQGDLGISLQNYQPVRELITQKIGNTLLLTGTALLLTLLFAIPVGVYSALRRGSAFDHLVTASAVAGFSVPTFWLGLLLIMVFAVKFSEWGLPSLPAGGAFDVRDGGGFVDRLQHLLLPALTLSFVQTAYWTRFVRSQMIEILSHDYIRSATAKGLPERLVLFRHGLRNALIPIFTLLGVTIPELFGGAVVVEQIFSWPGMGQLAFNAALNRDYPLIMGTVLVVSVLVILGNLLADVLYGAADPRIRFAS